jgi:hypothetical protein
VERDAPKRPFFVAQSKEKSISLSVSELAVAFI